VTKHTITDTDYATALEAGRLAAESEFRAQAVCYLPDRDAIEVITVRNGGFVIPRDLIGVLQDVGPDDLAKIELWPDGSLIEIEDLSTQSRNVPSSCKVGMSPFGKRRRGWRWHERRP